MVTEGQGVVLRYSVPLDVCPWRGLPVPVGPAAPVAERVVHRTEHEDAHGGGVSRPVFCLLWAPSFTSVHWPSDPMALSCRCGTLAEGLIDENEFIVHPRVAGPGPTMLAELSRPIDLKLVERMEIGATTVAMRHERRQ